MTYLILHAIGVKMALSADQVNIGAKIKVYDEKYDEEIEYTLVGSTEADPLENKISDQSPIGSALIGAKIGDTVTAVTPNGELKLKVLDITK